MSGSPVTTARHAWLPIVLGALPLLLVVWVLPEALAWFARWQTTSLSLAPYREAFGTNDATVTITLFVALGGLACLVAAIAAVFSLLARSAVAHRCLRWAMSAGIVLLLIRMLVSWWVVGTYGAVQPLGEEPLIADPMTSFWLNFSAFVWTFFWIAWLVAAAWLANTQIVRQHYGMVPGTDEAAVAMAAGDVAWEDVRTGGKDPEFRRAWQSALGICLLILFGPYLLTMLGCIEPYRVPQGAGNPVVAVVVTAKVKKTEEILLNEYSSISFNTPDPEESDALAELEVVTERTYEQTQTGTPGPLGEGPGDEGGWPDGLPNGELRWIQLSFGQGTDDGLTPKTGNAVANFMRRFGQLEQVKFPVRPHGESHSIGLLNSYPKDQQPPWVVMTSDFSFSIGGSDLQTLIDYVNDGGMIFGDAGSAQFHRSFMGLMKTMGNKMGLRPVTIGLDDPIHNRPYRFPDGFPSISDHGVGSAPWGLKNKEGSWIVYYFPGDLNDAWKDRSSVDKRNQDKAFHMGINIIYYAVTNYVKIAAQKR